MIKRIKIIHRLLRINWVLAKHGLDECILALPVLAPLRFLAYLNPWNWFRDKQCTRGERIRLALTELGPIFVKFGQMLSTRCDIFPEDVADELAKLQDQVPPFASELVLQSLEKIYGQPVTQVFAEFSVEPLASASIAQVHVAKLHTGEEVVIKVLRPNVQKQIQADLAIMEFIAGLMERYWSEGPRLRPREVVAEFERTLHDELDLQREAANASQLKRNFLNSHQIYVPIIYWPYTHKNVLAMERIHGIPISNIRVLKEHKVNLKKLAEHGVEIFFTQVFRDRFFHADMHPGNVFVNIQDPANPVYAAVDFGIMGTLSPLDQHYLAANFLAFFKRDYQRVAELHIESGWINPQTRLDIFESAVRTVCEPMFERPLKEISCAKVLLRLFETAHHFEMEVQPQLLLLQKTLLNVEGLGRQLYPDLDLWQTAQPFLEQWVKQKFGARVLFKKVILQSPYWFEKLPQLPNLIYDNLRYQKTQALLSTQTNMQKFKDQQYIQQRKRSAAYAGIGFTLFVLGGVMLLSESGYIQSLFSQPFGAMAQIGAGALVLGLVLQGYHFIKRR